MRDGKRNPNERTVTRRARSSAEQSDVWISLSRVERELYERGELSARPSARDASKLDVVKQAAKSQLSYFKLAVLGARKPK